MVAAETIPRDVAAFPPGGRPPGRRPVARRVTANERGVPVANLLLYPKLGAMAIANLVQAGLAASVLSLFKEDISVTTNTTKAELEAIEADYDGYLAKTIAAWLEPYLDPEGGASVDSGEQVLYWTLDTDAIENQIYGFWLETAGGVVVVIGRFVDDQGQPAPIPMVQEGNAVPLTIRLVYGRSA